VRVLRPSRQPIRARIRSGREHHRRHRRSLSGCGLSFTPSHRGGSGTPLVCLHGFTDTWRTWELVLPALEHRHDVLALTLPGHAGGPPLGDEVSHVALADAIERAMDDAGFAGAHIAGNSLGGYLALHLAARGRAESVVALAPAGGWAVGDESWRELLAAQAAMLAQVKTIAPQAATLVRSARFRRSATRLIAEHSAHIPGELIAHQLLGVARCDGALPLIACALAQGYSIDAERISCPVRIVWGTADKLLPWPAAAARYRRDWLPQADWIELEGVGHSPQVDVPLEAAQLILGFTAPP
jgi:pimeloyl-ACP methyl ester carboxylesterase